MTDQGSREHDPLTCELCHAEGVGAELAGLRAERDANAAECRRLVVEYADRAPLVAENERLRSLLDADSAGRVALRLVDAGKTERQRLRDAISKASYYLADEMEEPSATDVLMARRVLARAFDEPEVARCPACKGEGGAFHEHASTLSPWIECKACGGSGEFREEEGK